MKPRGCRLELWMSLLFVCLGKVVWVRLLLLMSGRDGGLAEKKVRGGLGQAKGGSRVV